MVVVSERGRDNRHSNGQFLQEGIQRRPRDYEGGYHVIARTASGKDIHGCLEANAATKNYSGAQESFSGDYFVCTEGGQWNSQSED